MLRRLITLLAILTGLTAVGAPAHAGVTVGLDATLELSQQAEQLGQGEAALCVQRQQAPRAVRGKSRTCRRAPALRVVIPTVMLGPDRALE